MRVHFYARHLYYLPQFLPVAEVMSESHEVSFGYSDRVTRGEEQILRRGVTMRGWPIHGPSDAQARAQQADILIVGASAGVEDLAGASALVVLLFHSIGMKKIYYTDTHPRINVRFIESDYHRTRCLEYAPEVTTHAVGFAKLDPLYGEGSPNDLSLPSGEEPKILYAPTFYPGSIELLGHLIPSWPRDWQIVIKPHQFTLTNPFYRYQRVLLQDLSKQYANITLLPLEAYNILPAFRWADVLVSEISSTIIEYTVMDRPIVVCDQVHLRWHHRWGGGPYFQRRLDTELLSKIDFAHRAVRADEVSNKVQYALEHRDELSAFRQAGRDLLVGPYDGQASRRIAKLIEEAVA
ncbi:MAG: CDP-glycerol glycerophosphotransferase family protein [Fidelibacterota bacterium]|nr:MAG: CDP-glycerol glycerophosphotransferase family protein [Candidatus Neomarinimicrobiota bacterium]